MTRNGRKQVINESVGSLSNNLTVSCAASEASSASNRDDLPEGRQASGFLRSDTTGIS